MIEGNASVRNIKVWILRIVEIALLIQNLGNTARTRKAHRDHNEYHRKHHEAHQNVHAVGQKAHQLSCCQAASDDHLRTEPADQKNTAVNGKLHQRRVEGKVFLCFTENFVDVLCCFVELTCFMILTHIRFYYADGGYVFLYARIQLIVLRKCLIEIFHRGTHDQKQTRSEDKNGYQINACKTCIDIKRHNHRDNHARRCTHAHTKNHLIGILQVGDVCRQAGDKTCGAEFVDIRK